MDNRHFKLKRSFFVTCVSVFYFAVLMTLLYRAFTCRALGDLLHSRLGCVCAFFRKTLKITSLEYLDGSDWNLQLINRPVQRVRNQSYSRSPKPISLCISYMHVRNPSLFGEISSHSNSGNHSKYWQKCSDC